VLRLFARTKPSRMHTAYRWFDERTGSTELLHKGLYEAVPEKGGWAYTLGSATLVLILLQIFTGIFLLLVYEPSFAQGWSTLRFLQDNDRFGSWVRGMHLWGAYVLILVIGLHMLRTFISASYKRPRELNWVTGSILFLLVIGLAITGAMLPMDQAAYWTMVVVTNIPHYIPFIGDGLRQLWRGSDFVGQVSLTRTFAIHIWVLPFLLLTFIGAHLYLLRRHGEFGSWVNYTTSSDDPEKELGERLVKAEPPYPTRRVERRWAVPRATVEFFPTQLFKDTLISALFITVIFVFGYVVGAPLSEQANPATLTYVPAPEWFFLPLDQVLVLAPQTYLIFTVTIVVLGIALGAMILLPFLDRSRERSPLRRPEVLLPGLFLTALLILLTVLGANRLYNL
jgi:quinol-cytochrome oxidoreductase complex cytochrome b subunit